MLEEGGREEEDIQVKLICWLLRSPVSSSPTHSVLTFHSPLPDPSHAYVHPTVLSITKSWGGKAPLHSSWLLPPLPHVTRNILLDRLQ